MSIEEDLYNLQNPEDYSNKKFIVYNFVNGDHGVGSEYHMMIAIGLLMKGMITHSLILHGIQNHGKKNMYTALEINTLMIL